MDEQGAKRAKEGDGAAGSGIGGAAGGDAAASVAAAPFSLVREGWMDDAADDILHVHARPR